MPIYDYYCPECYKIYRDISVKLADKSTFKLTCDCGVDTIQKVAGLNFELKGVGWFRNSESGEGYSITESETRKNLEHEKRAEDFAQKIQSKERNSHG